MAEAAPTGNHATEAFNALKDKDYDRAVASFRRAIEADPARADYRKEMAYTLLKMGETEEARDQFEVIVKLEPKDWHSTMEYGYLCHETRRVREARRVFDLVRKQGDPESRKAAETAFLNVDKPLEDAILRWTMALAQNASDFSAHQELAHAAEDRANWKLAAEHYKRAWELNPAYRGLLVDLGRTLQQLGDSEGATAAFLAASRGDNPRAAEAALEFLPKRTPYASEFQKAIELDRKNVDMRRELAFLWLAVNKPQEAEAEFLRLLEIAPGDLLSLAQVGMMRLGRGDRTGAMTFLDKVLSGNDAAFAKKVREAMALPAQAPAPAKPEPKPADTKGPPPPMVRPQAATRPAVPAMEMAEKSYAAGYMKDAARFYEAALEDNPKDARARLKLGYTYNMLRQDDEAIRHFETAIRDSTDDRLRREARKAYRNLKVSVARVRTTVWLFPMFSSRWHSGFAYGQVKTELRLRTLPIRPYVSLRFVGDSQRGAGALSPQYLSESSFIGAVGVATSSWKGLTAWAEAGNALRYRDRPDIGRMTPDYRAGASFGRAIGPGKAIAEPGWFVESHADVVMLSRFRWNTLGYLQNRGGYTLPPVGPLQWQLNWNANVVTDRNRELWANFFDTGPGVRFRLKSMPASMSWSVDLLRGAYLLPTGGARKPEYYDIRAGIWYAFTH
ncbi:MAG: tetratricopeptide repeat protein [Acidobacteria bacterium]|nr:tetratricopeptide repeat protein [Acidobacteriota bacterium]